jgi:predicted HNH restriction endonuclease
MTGETLNRRWNVNARHALFSNTGRWYHQLKRFPGALFDLKGYLLFKTEEEYRICSSLSINQDIWAPHGIASAAGYVQVVIDGSEYVPSTTSPSGAKPDRAHYEGNPVSVSLTVYERDREARTRCLQHYGYKCTVCLFDFSRTYGEIGVGMIHVHHLTPVSRIGETHAVDPIHDLRPICPNCHAVIHRRQPPFSIEEVEKMMGTAKRCT